MRDPIRENLRLSYGQQALWYLNQLETDSTAYHLGICLELCGSLNEKALIAAWADVGMGHPQLRARFVIHDNEPAVVINPATDPLRIEMDEVGRLNHFWRKIAERPFALEKESPIRAHLVRGVNGSSHLLLCTHHIVADLWSSAIILQEFSAGYQRHISKGGVTVVAREQMDYTAFTVAESHWLNGLEGLAAWEFWRAQCAGLKLNPILIHGGGNAKSGEVPITLSNGEAELVRRLAQNNATTPYAVLLACYARLLGEETGRDEFFIGSPATVRNRAALRNTVGYLVNAVPVRCPVGDHGGDSVAAVAINAQAALKQRRFPFPVLVERLNIPRTAGVSPVFQTMFAYQSLPRVDRSFLPLALGKGNVPWDFGGGLTARSVAMPAFDAQFPLALVLGPNGEEFSGNLQYDGRRVTAERAAHLAERFPNLIREFLTAKKIKSRRVVPNVSAERLDHLFDETARRIPDAIAVSEGGVNLSYAEVKTKAEVIAAGLNVVLLDNNRPVAVQMSSSAEAAMILLGILKSGRTFHPIDPDEPEVRRNTALLRTEACALISSGADLGVLPAGVVALTPEKLRTHPASTIHTSPLSQTAYLVFTSGSTGEPKAVEVEHAAVINHARATARLFGLTPGDQVLQFHTLAFDAAFEEIFPTWHAGACVVFEPQARKLGVPAFLDMVEQNKVTVLNLPTSYWHLLTTECVRLNLQLGSCTRLWIVGGESASAKVYSAWRKLAPDCRWINTYGPTEATITALTYEPKASVSVRDGIPIGQPIEGITTLLLNKAGKPISSGVGELLIGGKGLALGYCGDLETTTAKFVMHTINGRAQRFYRTGDRVRLRRDGNFEYLGRLDRQLKIRGYRVDPDEIEQVLRDHPSVADAAVMPQQDEAGLTLTAWITRAKASLTVESLRAYLLRHLPPHMIPSRLTFVTRLPRKPSGKLDTAGLSQIGQPRQTGNRGDELEVVALFSELLGHKVGPHDDFFLSGGHSLLAIRLLGRVEARFGVRISVSDFVAAPTAQGLWRLLKATAPSRCVSISQLVQSETLVSAQQKRALFAHEIGLPSLANIVLLFQINGRFDELVFQRAVETVASQNFLLRSGFFKVNAGVVLREAEVLRLERRTLPEHDFKKAISELVELEGSKPFVFDASTPWIRLILVSTKANRQRHLILITHHAVADGWGLELLLDDLRSSYGQACSDDEALSVARDYRIYAHQQANWLKSAAAQAQVSFWKNRLAGVQELRLPFRHPAAAHNSWQVERIEMSLSLKLSNELRRIAGSYRVTPFALLMACFKALLHRRTGQADFTLGTVVSNRSAHANQNIFGPLQNPVLVRAKVTATLALRALAQRVARSLVVAQENGTLPFEEVVREALPHRTGLRDGGIQFLSHDRTVQTFRLGPATLASVELPHRESPFELCVSVAAAEPRIKIAFEYQPTAYEAVEIRCLSRQYTTLLQSVAAAPLAVVGKSNLISATEHRGLQRRISQRHIPQAELLHEGFESQACRSPAATAIVTHDYSLTYGELQLLTEFTAKALVERGLKKKGLVAVMLPKGWEQVVACLAILKAGGVYVPLDPTLPAARLQTIFEQGGFHAAIVADVERDAPWAQGLPPRLTIHSRTEGAAKFERIQIKPDSLAYVIFTSGSTGVPKGVMVSHQAAMTTIAEINRRFKIQSGDRVLAVSALGFDLSVFDVFGTLRAGGTIIMPESRDPKNWLEQLVNERVTVWNSVPCLFELLLDEATTRGIRLETLRLIMLSGDFTSLALARRIRTTLPQARLVCLGGATEAAIWSIAREVDEVDPSWHRIPYGLPLRRQEMFVLDGALDHCAPGIVGELFIAGAGLAAGYWRNRAETKRRFLNHPRWNIRLYRTGDQGRCLANGEIEILGRRDEQVKINGVRLELGEIETVLCTQPSVRQAIAEVRTDAAGNQNLIAFVAADSGTDGSMLLEHAKKILPGALIPSCIVVLERLPLNSTGKVDRQALRVMSLPAAMRAVALPETPTEQWIADLWSKLLNVTAVGVEDDFFALGGHSLLAIRMLQGVRSHFAVDLPLSLIIERPTVRGIAAGVKATTATTKVGLAQRPTSELKRDAEPVISSPMRRTNQQPTAILLTGATGHLGATLLAELLEKTSDPICCLVRAGSKKEAEARILKVLQSRKIGVALPPRIIAIPAYLGREFFGLEPAVFAELAMSVRAIYHCAAEVNFIASYEKLAASNVGGVREVIRLATAAGAVLHHVSSVAVFPYGGGRILREDEDITRVQTLTGGYAQTKWTAELMVWKAIARGLRAVIYRPAQIIGRTGGPPQDLFDHALQVCRTLRSVPDIETSIDLVTSGYAAAAIRALSIQESSLGKAFHLVHPEPVSLRDFVGFFPTPLPVVPLDSWHAALDQEARQRNDPSLQFVSMLAQGLERADLTPPGFDCSGTMAGLHNTGVVCPALDQQFVRRELTYTEEKS